MDRQQRLRIAVQKSGRLTDESLDLLHRCGLKFSRGKDQLMCYGENMPLDVLFVRDDDIPDLVQEDVCDLGIVGLNVLEEKRLAFAETYRMLRNRISIFVSLPLASIEKLALRERLSEIGRDRAWADIE